jgi:hypothetical protein
MIGSFLLGFTYCDGRERESDRKIMFRCSFIGFFFYSYCDNRERLFMFDYDTKEKEGNLINTRGLEKNTKLE